MAGDDLLEGVQQQVLPLGVGLDLRQDEGKILLQIARAHASCRNIYIGTETDFN